MAAFRAARRGVVTVLEFDENGQYVSYIYDEKSGIANPLLERGRGVSELAIDDFAKGEKGLFASGPNEEINEIRKCFWSAWMSEDFDLKTCSNNEGQLPFAFDI